VTSTVSTADVHRDRVVGRVAGARPHWRGKLHRGAFFTALGLAPGLVAAAPTPPARLAVAVYALSLMGLFGFSALLHRVEWSPRSNRIMRRIDHAMIFVFIAGTYTPIAAITFSSPQREQVLVLVWAAALAGAAVQLFWIDAPRTLTAGSYIAVGWIALLVLPTILDTLGVSGFALLLGGGVAYTVGAVVYARKRPDPVPHVFGFHEVFHACTIVAALLHLAVISFWVLPQA
jgi:hemolysin III